jgi:outer membrane scaffolding protein for murein synthesis (MipA/OmpV family)
VDAAYELGFGVAYAGPQYEVFANVRRGFGGHEAWVGELGMDGIARPTDRLAVKIGPRLFYGSDDYADTYFGVSQSEAARSPNFGAYEADGGLLSVGAQFGVSYQLSDNWRLDGAVTYDVFTNDAEDSPIVQQGDREYWGASIGVTRAFRIGG